MERTTIIADTDFLSAFLKIDKLDLVFKALETEEITITKAVLQEIEKAPVYQKYIQFTQSQHQKIRIQEVKRIHAQNFGMGELESISLAIKTNALLLMNDRKAAKVAEAEGVTVMDIPIFLLYCKTSKILDSSKIKEIIEELKQKDYYELSEETKKMLLE